MQKSMCIEIAQDIDSGNRNKASYTERDKDPINFAGV